MKHELIIEGQHVDIASNIDVTLEYVNDITGDPGKISLSHSYTIKLPKTLRNARILDDPGRPEHESGAVRRYLSVRYYRNGVDLIGPAQAYVLKVTSDAYEVALVWNTCDALQALSQSDKTLNDLPDLPVLTWIGANGTTPDYSGDEVDGALFAHYNSGLGAYTYPSVNAATHPCMRISNLIWRILTEAGVPYVVSTDAQAVLRDLVVLAAPNHAPNEQMERESGSSKYNGVYFYNLSDSTQGSLSYENYDGTNGAWQNGWDPVYGGIFVSTDRGIFKSGEITAHRVVLNLKGPDGFDLSGAQLEIRAKDYSEGVAAAKSSILLSVPFARIGSYYTAVAETTIQTSGWPVYEIWLRRDAGWFPADATPFLLEFEPYDTSLPIIAVNRIHEEISIANDNRFPLEGNLPDIKQWEFVKACMAWMGLAPVIKDETLHIVTYAEMLDLGNAYDWTAKVDMTDGGLLEVSPSLDKWAQYNRIAFADNEFLTYDPAAVLEVSDATLSESREWYELPFAASQKSDAPHYEVEDGEVKDVDMEPRVFRVFTDAEDARSLYFDDGMYGDGLISEHYARLQEVVRKPLMVTANLRLNELDLASLDLTCPVFLRQYGRYFVITKIQTSNTELCKVELVQIT